MESWCAASTVESYRRDLRRYASVLADRGKTRLGEITPADVADFLASLREGDAEHAEAVEERRAVEIEKRRLGRLRLAVFAEIERELLAKRGALLSGQIGTFDDLFERLARDGGSQRPVVTDAQRQLIVRTAVSSASLNGLGPSARFAG